MWWTHICGDKKPLLEVEDLTSSFAALKMTSSCWQIYEGLSGDSNKSYMELIWNSFDQNSIVANCLAILGEDLLHKVNQVIFLMSKQDLQKYTDHTIIQIFYISHNFSHHFSTVFLPPIRGMFKERCWFNTFLRGGRGWSKWTGKARAKSYHELTVTWQ